MDEGQYIYTIFTYIIRDWTKERINERKGTEAFGNSYKNPIKTFLYSVTCGFLEESYITNNLY